MREVVITRMAVRRKRLGLSQATVAAHIGVTQPRVSAWENRRADLPPKRREQIAELLGIDADTLTDPAA